MATLDTLADVPTTEGNFSNFLLLTIESNLSVEKTKEYTQSFLARIRSFHNDPLHSAAYLGNLAQFLHKPNQKSARHARQPNPQRFKPKSFAEEDCRPFVYEYSLFSGVVPKLTTFDDVDKYKQTISIESYNADCNELIFLAGRPSAEWLSAVGARYKLDHRFFHQHLSFLPTGQRDWFTAPTLPSRSHNVVRFCIPSLLFVGEHRYVNIGDLQKARGDCERQLLSRFRSYQEGTLIEAGKSIVRRMNIHSGDNLVIEQELSFSLLKRGDRWTGISIKRWYREETADVYTQCLFGRTLAKTPISLLYPRLTLINSKAQSIASNFAQSFLRRTFPKSLTFPDLRLAPRIHG